MSGETITIAEAYGWKLRKWTDKKGSPCSGWTTPEGEQCGGNPPEWMVWRRYPKSMAMLFAHSQELLEALKGIVEEYDRDLSDRTIEEDCSAIEARYQRAREVIAKATGKEVGDE